jgi:phosphoserine phosphatase
MLQRGIRMVQTRAKNYDKNVMIATRRRFSKNSKHMSATTNRCFPKAYNTGLPSLAQPVCESKRVFSTGTDDVKKVWEQADAVCFDVDSTVCTDEGIDVLAAHCGVGEDVANLTKNAMEGNMSYRDSLAARLELMKPSKSRVDKCIEEHPGVLSPGMADLVKALHAKGKHVFLVSGGFKQLILPVAAKLNIPADNVYANVLLFDGDAYKGFDENQPTSQTGGKAVVVKQLIESHNFKSVVMVGDGATDMEARPPASLFIGYGGVVTRSSVKAGADWFVTDFNDLIGAL